MKLFRRKSLDERMALALVRAMEQSFPQQWTSLSEARKPRMPPLRVTAWTIDRSVMTGLFEEGGIRHTVTLEARGWPQ